MTLEEFAKLPKEEREQRYKELSDDDKFFVRVHDCKGGMIPSGRVSKEEALKITEEAESIFGIDLSGLK